MIGLSELKAKWIILRHHNLPKLLSLSLKILSLETLNTSLEERLFKMSIKSMLERA